MEKREGTGKDSCEKWKKNGGKCLVKKKQAGEKEKVDGYPEPEKKTEVIKLKKKKYSGKHGV